MSKQGEVGLKVAISGIEKPLGKALRAEYAAKGFSVIPVGEADIRLPAPTLGEKLNGVHGIINLFGEPYVAKWKKRYEFDIYRSRLVAIRSLGMAMKYMETRPNFFITTSNAMIYDKYEVHDEYSMSYGDTLMAEVGQMETAETMKISSYINDVRLIIARTGYIMSKSGGVYPMLERLAKIGWGGKVDDGYQCIPMIAVDDAARAFMHITENQRSQGVYNLTIPEMASMNELVEALSKTHGKNQHRLPKFLIKLVAGRAVNLLEQNCKVQPLRLLAEDFEFKAMNVSDIMRMLS